MFTSTGNCVTFWVTCACGSIFSTEPSNGRLGYASTVIVTGSPGWILPMSVSSTRACTCTVSRFAMRNSTVPPPTSRAGLEITVPTSTFFWMIVPVSGRGHARLVLGDLRVLQVGLGVDEPRLCLGEGDLGGLVLRLR